MKTCVISQNMKIKINSDDDLALEKKMHNEVILIKSILNKNHNHYYFQGLIEKCSCKWYIITGLVFVKEFMLIKQVY